MPSGAKRRKNAKKKKDKKASNSNTTSSVGSENLKHESDGEHNGEQHFTEGEEEEVIEKREDAISHVEENESADVENHGERRDKLADKERMVQIERESKLADDFDNKRGVSSSSNSSSSDDKSHSVEKDISVVGNAPVIDNVEVVDSLTEVPIQTCHATPVSNIDDSVVEAVVDDGVEKVLSLHQSVPEGSDMIELEPKENGERKLCTPEDSDRHEQVVKVVDPEPKDEVANAAEASGAIESVTHDGEENLMHAYNEPEGSSASVDNNSLISETVESELKESGEKEFSSVEESARLTEVVKDMAPEQKNDKVPTDESATHDGEDKLMRAYNEPEGSSASVDNNSLISETLESELKESGEKELSSVEESARITEVVKDMAPEQNSDKVPNDAATSGAKESAAHESEVTPVQAYNAPRDDVAKDMEHMNDSDVIGSSRGQAIGLSPVQTTSWKSCCGLFELFAGSNR